MWFGEVEIPSELVDAHRAGELVLFVGAGASRDAPSCLPDFRGLTSRIAKDANFDIDDDKLNNPDPDILLGLIEDGGVDVHRRVRDLLGDPESSPNRLHEAIIDLALTAAHQRLVTTNFDRHLSAAFATREADIEEYTAPALPVGNNFTGLVYLHGKLDQPADRLVVTDADFGKAYLRDAWAARFLERMFARFSVLFVGYSHGDVVMRYLARSLGPDGHRFVLTPDPESREWRELGLQPIGYPIDETSHAALGEAIARWADVAGMGLLDHRERIANLLGSPPSGIPEEMTYLEEIITDPVRVRFFTESATTAEWLDWADNQPVFTALFDMGAPSDEVRRSLADWFVRRFVMNGEHRQRALRLVRNNGGHLGVDVCGDLGFQLNRVGADRPEWLGVWLVLLVSDAPTPCIHWLEGLLTSSSWPQHREQVMLLFDHLTQPMASLAVPFSPAGSIEVVMRGNRYALQSAWENVLKPHLDEIANDVVALADRHLRRASRLRLTARQDSSNWDPASFGRSAIAPTTQDRIPTAIDVLIDAARDGIETLLDTSDPSASVYLSRWESSDSLLLRRIVVHGWSHRSDVDASTKLDWLASSGWLFNEWCRREVTQLIAGALPSASDGAIGPLLVAASQTVQSEPDYMPYERFRLLARMDRVRPGHPQIRRALAEARAVDPTWQIGDDSDLTYSIEVGSIPSRPPMTIEEFHDRLHWEPHELLSALRGTKGVHHWDGQPTWDDATALIASAVTAEPSDGLRVLGADSQDDDVVRAVIDGWSHVELDDELAVSILDRIATLSLEPLVSDVAWMLSSGGRVGGYPTNWSAYHKARQLSLDIWPLISADDGNVGGDDWLTMAINHSAGSIAEFWVDTVQYDWQADEKAWVGLSDGHRHALEMMLAGPADHTSTHMAEVICAGRFNLLFAADPDWSIENVLPNFDWTDPARAMRVWASFTKWSRWNDRMLDAGLMEHFLETVKHLDDFQEDERGPILGQLAGVALTSSRDPHGWLPGVITTLSDGDRVLLADKIAGVLDDLPEEAVERQWERWIRSYWTDRLDSVLVQLSFGEATAMAEWVPALTTSFESGVDLVTRQPCGFREHDDILRRLDGKVDSTPDVCARMIVHLMKGTEKPWWGDHRLRKMMSRLRAGSGAGHVKLIVGEGLRLGIDLS